MNDILSILKRLGLPRMHLRSLLPARAVVIVSPDDDGNLLPAAPAFDQASARESTQQDVLNALQLISAGVQTLNGNTDGLESLTQQQRDLLSALTGYTDNLEGLLSTLSTNTDGIEGLLSALGLKDDNVLSKLEALRVLLAGTLSVSAASLPLPAGAATETTLAAQKAVIDLIKARLDLLGSEAKLEQLRVLLAGTLQVRANPEAPAIITLNIAGGSSTSDSVLLNTQAIAAIDLGPNWTAADLTVEHTTDGGTTWYPMYDTFGNLIQYRISANRSVVVPLADLMRRGRIRFRSGVPGAYVNQGVVTVLTLTLVTV